MIYGIYLAYIYMWHNKCLTYQLHVPNWQLKFTGDSRLRVIYLCSLVVLLPALSHAEHAQLPTIIITGDAQQPGTLSIRPDSSGLKDAASLLKRVPGANVNRSGPLTGIAQYRGLYGNRINIEIDGMSWKEVGPNSMDPPLSHTPAALTESLQVIRGISPVSSGIETIGGSMKVNIRKGNFATEDGEIEWDGIASGGYGTVDEGRFGAVFSSIANKNHKLYVNGSHETGSSYRYTKGKSLVPTQYQRNAYLLGYAYQRDGHEFNIGYSNNDTGRTGTPALPMDIQYVRGGVNTFEYSGEFDGVAVDSSFYYQNMRHAMNNFQFRQTPMPGMRQNRTTVEGIGGKLTFTVPVLSGDFSFGFEGDTSAHDAHVTNPSDARFSVDAFNGVERERHSIFAQWLGDISDKTSLEAGIRYSYIHASADRVMGRNPMLVMRGVAPNAMALNRAFNGSVRDAEHNNVDLSLILKHAVTDKLSVELGFGRKTRAPSYQELFLWIPLEATGGLADGKTYIGHLNLNAEVAYQAELGVEWHSSDVFISPRFFYHYVKDYIQGDVSTNTDAIAITNAMGIDDPLQFNNIDAQLYGFDVEGSYSITDNLLFDTVLSYVRGDRTDKNDNLYRIAPFNARTQLTYYESFWSVGIEGVFYAKQNAVARFNDELKTPGYALLNLRGQIEPISDLTIGLGIENVLGKNYADHLAGLNRVGSPELAQGSRIRSPGRNFYATVSYAW